jgi:LacI family transcriptional regulator
VKRPTMTDVAERAGVSKATVSHVLNRTRFVQEETRRRVLQAIAELGYRPSVVARSLTTKRTQTVGVLISDVSNHFFAEVLCGVDDVLMPESYSLVACNTGETPEREAHYLDLLLQQRVDGLIAAAASQRWEVLTEFEQQHMPVVFVDRHFEGLRGPFVGVNNQQGAYLGTSHLIRCGHRKLGILAGDTRPSSLRERLEGFCLALQEHGIPLRKEWMVVAPPDAREAIRRLLMLEDRPSALFCSVSGLSLAALSGLHELGLRCPDDVALVGFDDHPWAVVTDPPLTVVRQPARKLGQTAARVLLALIRGQEPPETPIILECELVVRQSCHRG